MRKSVSERVDIISARVQGVDHGEELAWEELEWIQHCSNDQGATIYVEGEDDLAASLIADLVAERIDSSLGENIHIIEVPII